MRTRHIHTLDVEPIVAIAIQGFCSCETCFIHYVCTYWLTVGRC